MAKAESKEVSTKVDNSQLPAFAQVNRQDKAKIGNTDTTDLIIPRVKLIQKISPEVDTFDNAKPGQFWHTIAEQPLGETVQVIPILIRKTIALWAPRNDDRGILARSSDCIRWDEGYANMEFTVKPKGSPNEVKYYTRGSVAESGLAEFGSGIPGDPRSAPAASLTYNIMFFMPDFPDLSPAIVINTRSAIKPAKLLQSKIDLRPGQHYSQIYTMKKTDEKGDEGPYFGYGYEANGYVQSEDDYNFYKSIYERFSSDTNWRVNDEHDEAPSGGSSSAPSGEAPSGNGKDKF